MHKFIEEDLIQFSYNETSIEKTAQIKAALENDWELKEKYDLLTFTQQRLEEISLKPRQSSVNNILAYVENSVSEFSAPA